MTITIPQQLIDADARFCLVKAGEKIPRGEAWQTTPYKADDAILVDWLAKGGNYGVISGYGGICALDIDEVEQFNKLGFTLPPSFSVYRNNHSSRHYYFKCADIPTDAQKKWVKTDAIVDFRLGFGYMTVGAGSVAPLSRPLDKKGQMAPYEIEDASPVAILPWETIEALLIKTGMLVPDVDIREAPKKVAKPGFEIKENAKEGTRNDTLSKMIGYMVRAGFLYEAVEAACLQENAKFIPPYPEDELKRTINNMFVGFAKKEKLKEQRAAKREAEEAEREAARKEHPPNLFTPEMEELLNRHHPNVALAHILNNLYGSQANDGGEFRYDEDKQSWVVWNGEYWKNDGEGNRIIGRAAKLVFSIIEDTANKINPQLTAKLLDISSTGNITAAMKQLKTMVLVETAMFDADEHLINVTNGTLNAITGEFYPHKKTDYITRIADVEYVPEAKCPKWIEHLELVLPDEDTRDAFQLFMGHTLVGGNPENAAMFAYGGGKNGKTITFSVISTILGEYAIAAAASTFTEKQNDENARGDLARMKGARLVVVPEGNDKRRLDEGVLKNLTGGSDKITARFPYGRDFSFYPVAKLCFHTNHLPKIRGRDDGIWRRIFAMPFSVRIPEEKRIKDYDKILYAEEASGIFNWMIEGYKKYQEQKGLLYSAVILEAQKQYKANEDILADFLSAYKLNAEEHETISRAQFYQEYQAWCSREDVREKPFGKQVFNSMIAERRGPCTLNSRTRNYEWVGIRLRTRQEREQPELDL